MGMDIANSELYCGGHGPSNLYFFTLCNAI